MKNVNVYVVSSCNSISKVGKYKSIIVYNGRYKVIEKKNITDTTSNRLILLGIIECINLLKEPCYVTIYTKGSWGIREILNNDKSYSNSISNTAVNYDLKSKILTLCKSRGHDIRGILDADEVNYAVINCI